MACRGRADLSDKIVAHLRVVAPERRKRKTDARNPIRTPSDFDIYLFAEQLCLLLPPSFDISSRLRVLVTPPFANLSPGMSKEPIFVDFSLPLAELLRKGTAIAHEEAEKSQGAAWMVRGELDREEYVRFLMMLYHVYEYVSTLSVATAVLTHALQHA